MSAPDRPLGRATVTAPDPEIVRKAAEALEAAAPWGSTGSDQVDHGRALIAARAALAVAEPLIRADEREKAFQIAHQRAEVLRTARPGCDCGCQYAAREIAFIAVKIARGEHS